MTGLPRALIASCSWRVLLLASSLGCPGARASGDDAGEGAFTVALRRQQIPLHNTGGMVHHKSAYYGQISIGGPQAQLFDVVFDTGSGHLVIPSAMCKAETCRRHRRYRRRASLLAEDIDVDGTVVSPWQARDQITVSFGTGEVTGIFVRDRVCLGPPGPPASGHAVVGTSLIQKDVPRVRGVNATPREEDAGGPGAAQAGAAGAAQAGAAGAAQAEAAGAAQAEAAAPALARGCVQLRLVSAIDMTEDPFASFAFDGVMGLGLSSLSQTPEFNFVESAAAAGTWDGGAWARKLFAVFLAVSDGEESEITFGGIRRQHMEEGTELAWCSARDASDGHWQLDVLGIRANGQAVDFCAGGRCRAVVDTGTSLLGVPSDLGPELVRLLRHASSQADGSCSGPGPRLEIDLGNFTLVLDPADYARPEVVPEQEDAPAAAAEGAAATAAEGAAAAAATAEGAPPAAAEGAPAAAAEGAPAATAEGAPAAAASQGARGDGAAGGAAPAPGEERSCVPMLMHIDLPEPLHPRTLILGEPVLQRYYTAFDASVPRVGFAPARHLEPRTPVTIAI